MSAFAREFRSIPKAEFTIPIDNQQDRRNGEPDDGGGAWEQGRLAGLLDPKQDDSTGVPTNLHKRYVWWTQKAYADLTGNWVRVDSTGTVDGLATRDLSGKRVSILLGAYRALDSDTVRVRVRGLGTIPGLVVNEAVEAVSYWMPGGDSSKVAGPWVAPLRADTTRYLVDDGDSTEIVITGFGEFDAFSVELRPIVPKVTIAPGTFGDNEEAIQATDVGNTVIIGRQSDGEAWQEDNIQLKNGVRVIATDPAGVAIRGTRDTVIVFPENANAFTSFEGIELQAGEQTRVLANLKGNGAILDCTFRDMGVDSVKAVLVSGNASATLRRSTMIMSDLALGLEVRSGRVDGPV